MTVHTRPVITLCMNLPKLTAVALLTCSTVYAQEKPTAPEVLSGKGLAQHDFFYAGEAKTQDMYLVRNGEVVWAYNDANSKGEISDAVRMSNGNILFAHQFGITLITPEKKVLWHYDAPPKTETHTAMPIGKERVLFLQNGDPAKLVVVNITTGQTEKEIVLPVGNPGGTHGHFRHARLTAAGTILVAHMDMKKVAEYDVTGKEVWSVETPGPWAADRLKNGNTLITAMKYVREVNPKGETVWELTPADLPDYTIKGFQIATRLPNGNTVVNNWVNSWSEKIDPATAPAQAVEVTPEKKVVWALREWTKPNLGPATTIQFLDEPSTPEDAHFGEIR